MIKIKVLFTLLDNLTIVCLDMLSKTIKRRIILFLTYFIFSIALIVLFITMYLSKPMNPNEVLIQNLEVTDTHVTFILYGTINSSYKLEKYDHNYINNILTLNFYESILNGQSYPIEITIENDFSKLKFIKIVSSDEVRTIYEK